MISSQWVAHMKVDLQFAVEYDWEGWDGEMIYREHSELDFNSL